MKKVLAIVLACMMLIPALVGFGSFAAEAPSVEIVGKNVWFGETLYPMFAVDATEGYDVEVKVTVNDETTYTCYEIEDEEVGTAYVAPYGVAAWNITYEFKATAYLKDGDEVVAESEEMTYSVIQYLFERLYEDKVVGAEKAAHEALLVYAQAADVFHNEGANAVDSQRLVVVEGEAAVYTVGDVITLTVGDRTPDEGKEFKWEIETSTGTVMNKTVEEMAEGYAVSQHVFITLVQVDAEQGDAPQEPVTATITFNDKSKCTSSSTTQQVWEENGIIFTYNKAAYNSNLAEYVQPIRLYAGTSVTIEVATGINKIVFNCNSTSYATALGNSITGSTVSGKVVTVTLSETVTSFTIAKMSAQVRVDAITVNP